MANEVKMYIVPDQATPEQEHRAETVVIDRYGHQITWPAFHAYMTAIGTPIHPCADVETAGWVNGGLLRKWNGQHMLQERGRQLLSKIDDEHYDTPLVRRTDMEAQVAAAYRQGFIAGGTGLVAGENDGHKRYRNIILERNEEISRLNNIINKIRFPVQDSIGIKWIGVPPVHAERDGLHMVRERETKNLTIIRWYIQSDGRGQVCSISDDDSLRLYDRYIGPVFCSALNEGAAGCQNGATDAYHCDWCGAKEIGSPCLHEDPCPAWESYKAAEEEKAAPQ